MLRALKGGGSARRPLEFDMRTMPGASFVPVGSAVWSLYDVNAFVRGRDSGMLEDGKLLGNGESLPRTIGAGGQSFPTESTPPSPSPKEPAMGWAG